MSIDPAAAVPLAGEGSDLRNKQNPFLALIWLAIAALLITVIFAVLAPWRPPTDYGFVSAVVDHPVSLIRNADSRWFYCTVKSATGFPLSTTFPATLTPATR